MFNLLELGQRIKNRRIALNMTQEELGLKVGYTSRSSINKVELGKVDIPQSKIESLANALHVTPAFLMGWEEAPNSELRPVKLKKFRMLGEISCGKPIFTEEEYDSYIDASADIEADYCLTAKGESMIGARINDGDVVFIKQQQIVNNGEIAAVAIGDEFTLKYWYYYPEKQKLVLNPANPAFEPLIYTGAELDEVYCLGKAVCFMSNL